MCLAQLWHRGARRDHKARRNWLLPREQHNASNFGSVVSCGPVKDKKARTKFYKKLTERGEHLANPNKFMKDIQAKVDALKELSSRLVIVYQRAQHVDRAGPRRGSAPTSSGQAGSDDSDADMHG